MTTRITPLSPILPNDRRRGAVDVANSPGVTYFDCVFYDFSEASQIDDWSSGFISGGALRPGTGAGAATACLIPLSSVDMQVESTVQFFDASSNNAGFIHVRLGSTSGYYYRIGTFDYPWRISRFDPSETILVTGAGTPSPNTPYRLRAEVWTNGDGNVEIRCYQVTDGLPQGTKVLRSSYTDNHANRVLDGNRFGVGSFTSGFQLPWHDDILGCNLSAGLS